MSVDSPKAGGDDAGVVEHQHIVRTQIVEEVAELPVFDPASFPMQDQQTRWHRLDAPELVAAVIAGAKYRNGVQVKAA